LSISTRIPAEGSCRSIPTCFAIDDPAVFAIPEQPRLLFATEAIPQIVAEAGLKGLRFLMVDGPPQVATDVYTYRNEYFGFEVDIPDSYTVLTWRLGNMPPGTLDEPSTFQTADDDLPSNIGGYRRLFLARMYRPHDKALLDGEIALSVTKRDLDPKRGE
jgi:hypothetical protein